MRCYLCVTTPPLSCRWTRTRRPSKSFAYTALQHMETFHAESQSSLDLNGEASAGKFEESEYMECPIEGCGEVLLLDEMDFHVELHAEEAELYSEPQEPPTISKAEGPTPGSSRSRSPPPAVSSRQQTAIQAWRNLLAMPSSKRRASDGEKHSVISAAQARRLGVRRRPPSPPGLRYHQK